MKSLMLHLAVLRQMHGWVGTHSEKDEVTLSDRFAREGMPFLEVTLPTLDDALIEGLSTGVLPAIAGFRKRKGSALPCFLHSFWVEIFDKDGLLIAEPSVTHIRAIRQIARLHKKLFRVCSDDAVRKAVGKFWETDRNLRSDISFASTLSEIGQYLFAEVVRPLAQGITWLTCKHGPGATAERLDSVQRFQFDGISPVLLEAVGPEFFRATWSRLYESPPTTAERPARLVAVPKTATKPRLISIEPAANQFVQQGIKDVLEVGLDRIRICSYRSQVPNQDLAREASLSGALATLDLSEASDRVSYDVVKALFSWSTPFLKWLDVTRSRDVDLQPLGRDGKTVIMRGLNKFASMGSALTFPVETMVFTTIVAYSVLMTEGKRITRANVRQLMSRDDLRIYGDDIIVPVDCVPTLISSLTRLGLVVNESKSFWTGFFRESCGADYYHGIPVQPVYVRQLPPETRHDVTEIVSLSSLRDQIFTIYGDGPAIDLIDEWVISILRVYPWAEDPTASAGIARRGAVKDARWNSALQRHESYLHVPHYKREATKADGWVQLEAALHRLGRREEMMIDLSKVGIYQPVPLGEIADLKKITHHGRPSSAKLKRRWVPTT